MIPIEFRAKVARDVTNGCRSRGEAAETIKRAAQALQYADASRTDQKEFWKALKAEIEDIRRSIPERQLPAPVAAIVDAALEEIAWQGATLEGSD